MIKGIKENPESNINMDSDVDGIILRALAAPPKITETLINPCVSYYFRPKIGPCRARPEAHGNYKLRLTGMRPGRKVKVRKLKLK